MSDTESASRDLENAMNFLHGQTLTLMQAQNDATIASARFAEQIEKGATSGDLATEAGARTSDMLIALGQDYQDLIIAVAESGAGMEATQSIYDTQVTKFRELAAAAGLTTEDIDALVEALFAMPESLVTEIVVNGLEQKELVEDFKEVMIELDAFMANPEIDLDAEEANRKLGEILTQLTDLDVDSDTLVTVDAETGTVALDLQAIHDLLVEIEDEKATADVDADTSDADLALTLLGILLQTFASEEWLATLGADDQASDVIQTPAELATTFATQPYNPTLEATDQASPVIAVPADAATLYATSRYNPPIEATDAGAGVLISGIHGSARSYGDDNYNAQLEATDKGAGSLIDNLKGRADAFATTYNAILTASDSASGVIGGAAAAARGFAGTYTATLTTINRTVNEVATGVAAGATNVSNSSGGSNVPSNVRALGGMTITGGFRAMAAGDILSRGAQIQPGGSSILWAEDFDGESYIPHAPWKRERSTEILDETAALFGYGLHRRGAAPAGGTSVVVNSDFAPQINVTGVADRDVANRIQTDIEQAFRQFRRELSLALPSR